MSEPGPKQSEQDQWYFTYRSKQKGPATFKQLVNLAQSGKLDRLNCKVWKEGMAEWEPAYSVSGLFSETPPPIKPTEQKQSIPKPPAPPVIQPQENPKSRSANSRGYVFWTCFFILGTLLRILVKTMS